MKTETQPERQRKRTCYEHRQLISVGRLRFDTPQVKNTLIAALTRIVRSVARRIAALRP